MSCSMASFILSVFRLAQFDIKYLDWWLYSEGLILRQVSNRVMLDGKQATYLDYGNAPFCTVGKDTSSILQFQVNGSLVEVVHPILFSRQRWVVMMVDWIVACSTSKFQGNIIPHIIKAQT